ncbi:hypothetical protein EG832_07780 [bacterium]|nr:hypothetical protein [bacterium]
MEEIAEYNADVEQQEQAPAIQPEIEIAKIVKEMEKLQQIYQEQISRNIQLQNELTTVKTNLNVMLKTKLDSQSEIVSMVSDSESGEEKQVKIIMKYKLPSPRVRAEMLSIQLSHAKEFAKTQQGYLSRGMQKEWLDISTDDLDTDAQVMLYDYRKDIYLMQIRYNLLYFKAMIDDSQLQTEAKGWVRGDINSDFYQNIDYGEVEQAVISFRIYNNLR